MDINIGGVCFLGVMDAGIFIGARYVAISQDDVSMFRWSTSGKSVEWANWFPSEPSHPGIENCIAVDQDKKCYDLNCGYTHPFVCEQ